MPRITTTKSISKTGNIVTVTMDNDDVYTTDLSDSVMTIKDATGSVVTPAKNTTIYKNVETAFNVMQKIN